MKLSEINIIHLFQYSEFSPSAVVWNVDRFTGDYDAIQTTYVGKHAGSKTKLGYWAISVGDTGRYLAHRIVWVLHNGEIPKGLVVDHIDGDRANNRIENLRIVTPKQNSRNSKKRKDSSTGITGVCKTDLYYIAHWSESGKRKCKKFSIKNYGGAQALKLASEFRTNKIEELNANGDGYTETHGK